ncbi:CAP domain-containing protein [Streptomyces sp. NPDC007088]|uniref:CAP domain-containing protein n=1 Tax=Streptomyces sp. NPDC007088 TaxID=3364773 RepID=UPI00369CE0E8
MGRHRRSAADADAEPDGRAAETTEAYVPYAGPDQEPYPGVFAREPYPGAFAQESASPAAAPWAAPRDPSWEQDATLVDGPRAATRRAPSGARAGTRDGADHGFPGSPAGGGAAGRAGHRRKKRGGVPVRTGLLGVSAAVALGAVAVGTGLLPGGGYSFGDGHDTKVRAADSPEDLNERSAADGAAVERGAPSASRGTERSKAPSAAPSKESAKAAKDAPSAKKAPKPSTAAPSARTEAGSGAGGSGGGAAAPSTRTTPPRTPSGTPSRDTPTHAAPRQSAGAPAPLGGDEAAAAAAVLSLVNQERASAGCSPVRADAGLASLASDFSRDMAARDFFDHTDPDGDSPWDRADQAGVSNLGGENIARGQADAAAVMKSWMNSPGHRANILNCDYKTLGVGVHFGSGGPWWTQDFGF